MSVHIVTHLSALFSYLSDFCFVCMYTCQSIRLIPTLCIFLCVHISVNLSLSFQYVGVCLYLSICVFFCICMFVRILVFHYVYSLHLSFIMYTYFYLIVNMYASLMYVSVYTSPSGCMFLCVCVCLSVSICPTCFVNHYIFLYL